ncbi:MAG: type II secretion system GspH family protein [Proteobacteria bacterium]|nr:type II secretion system GspH family protein [Pseudomonadota bacterium]
MGSDIFSSRRGFTLIELLLVTVIIGAMLAVIVPRAQRAGKAAKFSEIRQYASEIGSYMNQWAQAQASSQRPGQTYTVKDYFLNDVTIEGAPTASTQHLVGRYTGNKAYQGVSNLIPSTDVQKNPFNEASYFSQVNDDPKGVPSRKAGLLYFASAIDTENQGFRNFYLLFTDEPRDEGEPQSGNWYGSMNANDPDAIRNGIFVARMSDGSDQKNPILAMAAER